MLKSRACAFTVPTPFRLVYVFVVVGSIGRFSVGVNEGVPQPPLESLEIRVGMTVKRGKDWQYGNQDGQGNDEKLALGTVIEVRKWKKAADVNLEGNKADEKADENVVKNAKESSMRNKYQPKKLLEVDGSVRVYWRKGSGNINVYRYGADDKYDVEIYDPSITDIDWEYVLSHSAQDSISGHILNKRLKQLNDYEYKALREVGAKLGLRSGAKSWISVNGWLETGSNPCERKWHGVKCTNDGHIYALDLSSNRLVGTLSKSIGQLSHLKTLSLSVNQITGPIPEEIGNLSKLEYLSIHDNRLNGGIPKSLGECTSLKWLSLFNNRLSGTVPVELENLKDLEYLYLQQNELSGRVPDSILNLPNLKRSQWHHNYFGKPGRRRL
eukprot:g3851.t1